MKKSLVFFCSTIALLSLCHSPSASILWQGNFETGDIGQWHTPINVAGLSVSTECVLEGQYAGKVRLSGDKAFLWKGNKFLNRSEFHHRPAAGSTQEGKDTFFAFSFYLPQQLSEHKHELGYWESDKSWQQTLRFNITGSQLSFQESAAPKPLWTLPQGAAAGQWHSVALHIHWSTDPKIGATDVWVNGEHKGKHHFKNLPTKDAMMFTQIGILRTQEDTIAEMLIDGAVETDNLADLLQHHKRQLGKTCRPLH